MTPAWSARSIRSPGTSCPTSTTGQPAVVVVSAATAIASPPGRSEATIATSAPALCTSSRAPGHRVLSPAVRPPALAIAAPSAARDRSSSSSTTTRQRGDAPVRVPIVVMRPASSTSRVASNDKFTTRLDLDAEVAGARPLPPPPPDLERDLPLLTVQADLQGERDLGGRRKPQRPRARFQRHLSLVEPGGHHQ